MTLAAREPQQGDTLADKGIRIKYQQPLKRLTPAMVARLSAVRDELKQRRICTDSTEIIEQARKDRFDEL